MPAGTEITTSGLKIFKKSRRFTDEILEHRFRDVIIGDDAVLQRPVRDDLFRRAADHFLGFRAHGQDRIFGPRQSDDGRFIDDKSPARHKNDGVRRAQIYADFLAKHATIKARKRREVKKMVGIRISFDMNQKYITGSNPRKPPVTVGLMDCEEFVVRIMR